MLTTDEGYQPRNDTIPGYIRRSEHTAALQDAKRADQTTREIPPAAPSDR
jgi:hypothetical protein